MDDKLTFRIRTQYLDELQRRFDKSAKRAAKLGVPAPTFTVESIEQVEEKPGSKVLTDEGDLVTWFCSGSAPEQGMRITGKATVKKHEDYRGEKQTKVNRWNWEEVA